MSEELNQLVRNSREIEKQKYHEELRIRAALAVLQGILSHGGVDGPARGYEVTHAFEYAAAFIEEFERRG